MKSKVSIKKVESYSIDKIEFFVHEALSLIDKTESLRFSRTRSPTNDSG